MIMRQLQGRIINTEQGFLLLCVTAHEQWLQCRASLPQSTCRKTILIYLPTFSELLHEIFVPSWSATGLSKMTRTYLTIPEDF